MFTLPPYDAVTVAKGTLAVIDIGSNSGRVVVVHREADVHLHVLCQERVPLGLAKALGDARTFDDAAIERTVAAVRDFVALATRAGAQKIVAAGTYAVRAASNGPALVSEVERRTGVKLRILPAEEEAALSFRGAIHGLDADHGVAIDVGGGSLEITSFRDRLPVSTASLPFGSVIATSRFLHSDPPTHDELEDLRVALREELADVRALRRGDVLVATGGTVRNVAKLDRASRIYPLERVHGYSLSPTGLARTIDELASEPAELRSKVVGLKRDRVDSIVAGGLVVQVTAEALAATSIQVSGQGLREGLALEAFGIEPSAPQVIRSASVAALDARLADRIPGSGARRAALCGELARSAFPAATPLHRELLGYASLLLDAGAAIDPYAATRATLQMLLSAELVGFTHESLAMLCAMVASSNGPLSAVASIAALLDAEEQAAARAAGSLLALAEQIERRLEADAPAPRMRRRGTRLEISLPLAGDWVTEVARKVRKHCGVSVAFTQGGS